MSPNLVTLYSLVAPTGKRVIQDAYTKAGYSLSNNVEAGYFLSKDDALAFARDKQVIAFRLEKYYVNSAYIRQYTPDAYNSSKDIKGFETSISRMAILGDKALTSVLKEGYTLGIDQLS